jgi:hypothetical protein
VKNQESKNKNREKGESILIIIGLFFAVISLFYERIFPIIFVITAIIFLRRSIKNIKIKDYKTAYKNIGIVIIFLIGMFLSI